MPPDGRLAKRLQGIAPFHVMALLGRARELEAQGRDIVHMEVGEPDFPTPEPITRAGMAALRRADTLYTPALGLPALREAIARHYRERFAAEVAPERIVITPGASGALLLALGLLVDPGDQVLMADPGYPCNRHFVRFLNGAAVPVPVGADSAYQLTAALLEHHWSPDVAAVLLASPSNPTGTLAELDEVDRMAAYVRGQGAAMIVDEIYQGLVYGRQAESVLARRPDCFVVNSFSKYFQMTGWRIGWLVVPPGYSDAAERLAQNLFLAAPTVGQHAALAAFEPETLAILEERRAIFGQRRDYLVPALRELGFTVPALPQGAFYVYAGCAALADDSYALAMDLLEQAGVAVTPGIDFGQHAPAAHLRFAYTTAQERLEDGVRRLRAFLDQRPR